jgi:hypothetical protein
VDFSSWTEAEFGLASLPGSPLRLMLQTDSIVWALAPAVLARMRQLDYAGNNLGWGIDTAACLFSHANGMPVVLDPRQQVFHPRGTAYDRSEATRQYRQFTAQLRPAEQAVHARLHALLPKRAPRPAKVAAGSAGHNQPCPCGSGRKHKQCCGAA